MIHPTNNITFLIKFQIFCVCGDVLFKKKPAATFEPCAHGSALSAGSADKPEKCRRRGEA